MTTLQLVLITCVYFIGFIALLIVIYFTRATSRRIVGTVAGGAVVGVFGMAAIVLGNAMELWARGPYQFPALATRGSSLFDKPVETGSLLVTAAGPQPPNGWSNNPAGKPSEDG